MTQIGLALKVVHSRSFNTAETVINGEDCTKDSTCKIVRKFLSNPNFSEGTLS
jgi:hypothetical protein